MPKSESQKLWQHAHPEKQKQYIQRYLLDKTRIIITIQQEDGEAIDKIKDPEESRSAWVKRLVMNAIANSTQPAHGATAAFISCSRARMCLYAKLQDTYSRAFS